MVDEAFAVESLRRCALFAHVDDEALRQVGGHLRRRRFRRNEVIFHQGDPGELLQIVASGAVKIALASPEGDEAIIATLRPGDFFGELALLDAAPRSATATAIEATETLDLPRSVFLEMHAGDPALQSALLKALATELRRLTRHVEELHFLDLAGRLATRLVRLATERSPGVVGRAELDWPYTQSDLASMIGGTRQSVNRLLAGLVHDGLVTIDRDLLVIEDVQRLEAYAAR